MGHPFSPVVRGAALGTLLLLGACTDADGPDDGTSGDTSVPSDTDDTDTDAAPPITIGGTLSGLGAGGRVMLENLDDDSLTLTADGPFTFATPVAPGAAYAVTVAAQPSGPDQRCEVSRGDGAATSSVTDVAVVCRDYVARFAYVVARGDDEVRQYAVDPDTGALTFLAKTAAGSSPFDIALNPTETCAYVANYDSDDVSQFQIGDDGVLTPLFTPRVGAGDAPWTVAVHPSGRHLYVSNVASDTVSQYDIGADCALTPMTTATVAAGEGPAGIGISPSGAHAYVANARSEDLSAYAIGSDGSLSPLGGPTWSYGGSGDVSHVVFDPAGEHLYVASDGANRISQFAVGPSGELAPLTPAFVEVSLPLWFTMAPSGEHAWVSTSGGDVLGFDVSPDGTLQARAEPAYTPDDRFDQRPQVLRVDPSGEHVYAAPPHYQIRALDIAADGGLSASPVGWQPAGFIPWSIAFSRGTRPAAPEPAYAYVVNEGDDTISQFSVDASGALVPLSPATVATGGSPASIRVDPSGLYAWVANYDDEFVSQYTVGTDGTLTPTATVDVGAPYGVDVVLDPFGRAAFLDVGHPVRAGLTADGTLEVEEGSVTGPESTYLLGTSVADPRGAFLLVAHTSLATYSVADAGRLFDTVSDPTWWGFSGFSGVAMDPLGRHAYVTELSADVVRQYTVADDGMLTEMVPPTVPAGSRPAWVTVDPTGRFAYVANSSMRLEPVLPGTVSQYAIGADGSLSPLTPATVATGGQPYQITLDPTGRYAYVANYADDTVSQYTVGSDGALVPMGAATLDTGSHPRFVLVTSRWR